MEINREILEKRAEDAYYKIVERHPILYMGPNLVCDINHEHGQECIDPYLKWKKEEDRKMKDEITRPKFRGVGDDNDKIRHP